MNIVLDASPLGIGFYHRKAKTGIGRVAEQLLRGLKSAPDVRLSLAAPTHLAETMRYARTTFGNAAPPLVNHPADVAKARLENALLGPFAADSLPSKAIREAFYRLGIGKGEGRFNPERFPAGTIYHSPFYALPNATALPKVRRVLTVHDLIPIHHPEWFPAGERAVADALASLRPDDWVITISESTKTDFCAHTGFAPERVTVIPLAASRELFHPVTEPERLRAVRQQFALGEGPYLLSLATLEPRKNLDHLIRCFVRLAESGAIPADVKLVLVGTKGWKLDQLLDEVARNEAMQARLVFTGFVPDESLAPLYAGARAFVYPSLYEGFGLPPLEAMQCGLPVICSNVSSLPEVVGEAAIQVAPTEADALCEAMRRLVQDDTEHRERAALSLQQAAKFSWERFTEAHLALYRTIS